MKTLYYLLLISLIISCKTDSTKKFVTIKGEFLQWHKITFEVEGPQTSEWAKENPFLDYKLQITFSKDKKTVVVPGYFSADGNAGETSADEGNIWKVHFRPDEVGRWNYKVSFRKGKNIVVIDGEEYGETVALNGSEGDFEVVASDKTGDDFRAKGRIINGAKGYFKFQGSDNIWIKNGADSPENFLAFADFDQTSRFNLKKIIREGEANPDDGLHKYEAHIKDWTEGDPSWKNGKGKGIIGSLNYLHSQGVNSVYMLTMNILGDGKDVWPYTDHNERYRFDCSKLDQWGIVFDHMEQLGLMKHFVLQETENVVLLDNGYTDVQRKIYLRELVARFGHYLAVTWNLGEENGPTNWSPLGQTDEQRKDMANYLKSINPYPNSVVLHTHSNDKYQDLYLNPLLGYKNLDGPSMQIADPKKVHERVGKWVKESEKAGKRWLVNLDEIGPHWKGVMPDSHDAAHDTIRHHCLWGTLMAGGTGVEWYFGYRYPHTDLGLEDFRSRDNWWKQSTIATQFIKQFPLEEMSGADQLVKGKENYCLAKTGEVYLIYVPNAERGVKLKTTGDTVFGVKWFNPRKGGELVSGNILSVSGNGFNDLGNPPSESDKDWLVLVEAKK